MNKRELIFWIIGLTFGGVSGYLFSYLHNLIYDKKIYQAIEEELGKIRKEHNEEVNNLRCHINRLNELLFEYQKINGDIGVFHCVKPETLPRNEINWQEVDFPNNKGDKI